MEDHYDILMDAANLLEKVAEERCQMRATQLRLIAKAFLAGQKKGE